MAEQVSARDEVPKGMYLIAFRRFFLDENKNPLVTLVNWPSAGEVELVRFEAEIKNTEYAGTTVPASVPLKNSETWWRALGCDFREVTTTPCQSISLYLAEVGESISRHPKEVRAWIGRAGWVNRLIPPDGTYTVEFERIMPRKKDKPVLLGSQWGRPSFLCWYRITDKPWKDLPVPLFVPYSFIAPDASETSTFAFSERSPRGRRFAAWCRVHQIPFQMLTAVDVADIENILPELEVNALEHPKAMASIIDGRIDQIIATPIAVELTPAEVLIESLQKVFPKGVAKTSEGKRFLTAAGKRWLREQFAPVCRRLNFPMRLSQLTAEQILQVFKELEG